MNPEALNELKRIAGKENFFDSPEDLVCYSYDSTPLEQEPEAVVTPTSAQMVSEVMRWANRERIPVVPRGAGTGRTGGPIPLEGSVVLSLTRMNRILDIDLVNMVVVTQPGVTTEALRVEAEKHGLFYPPDPASLKQCTLGGNVATSAGGPHGLKYGVTRDYVLGLEVILPTGEIIRTGSKAIKNATGYSLTHLLIGSEGTLGIITEITLRLLPLPRSSATIMAVFPRLEDATAIVPPILLAGIVPATIEMMDRLIMRCVEEYLPMGVPESAEAIILIGVDGDPQSVEKDLEQVAELCRKGGASEIKLAKTSKESDQLWAARRSANPSLGRLRPDALGEDISVPRSAIPEMVRRIREISSRYDLPIPTYGHIGDGNLHPNILFDKRNPEEAERVHQAAGEILRGAIELGGNLSGEHGVGLSKRDFLEAALGQESLILMREIKRTFDPNGILNPGKVFSLTPPSNQR